ncbi:DUF1684 domain-containing protein [Larkinella sp.]|uniref:DUF1684 domain-containing protein n=1 Tax=Larkinella sp. TaxID=2034517 RepID=UPI003BAA2495
MLTTSQRMEEFETPAETPTKYYRQFVLLWLLALVGSVSFRRSENPSVYKAQIDQWHTERITALKKESGWLNLAGLFWLKEGDNTVGGSGSAVAFPSGKTPAHLGTLRLKDGTVSFTSAPRADVRVDGKPLTESVTLFSPSLAKPVVLQHGSLRWFVIKRGNQYGIRLRDLESARLKSFRGIDRFPVDGAWQVKARLNVPDQPKTIAITDVLGLTHQQPLAGTLVFELNGSAVRLDAVGEGEKLFVLFADPTNGHETYGAGRFLYVDKPGPDGTTIVDFNKSINPPCAFTAYATCPLPPKQNRLALRITAGEKNTENH